MSDNERDETQQPGALRWHYGPIPGHPDPGDMWCYDCGGPVWNFEEGRICSGCGRAEEPEEPGATDE